jgi:hypothetical protein
MLTAAKAFADFVIESLFTIGCFPEGHLWIDTYNAVIIVLGI